jgi:hypothetical protein
MLTGKQQRMGPSGNFCKTTFRKTAKTKNTGPETAALTDG